ncbi:BF3164 family lipoprotein [Proteiniphilum sp. X52]|uniref:BF3164 family lipoprotein n=1 Tax=Proteiniphilum sp. X52 TaxID=2382159 RepID=UPI000F0A38FF|nr:BF3164 family lipoprotein [Proteiniphilum sp. X52]RNC63288.1 hypothetical protein D7D25_17290 [Proteiniphilum sp. X52]
MSKFVFHVVIVFIFFNFWNCASDSKERLTNMVFDDIKYIDNFPQSFSIDGEKIDIDVIGVRNFVISDSAIIMSTNNKDSLWVIASLPDLHVQGSILKRGQGPTELTISPSTTYNTKLIKEDNQLFAYIYEYNKGELIKLNISSSLNTGKSDVSIINDSLPKSLFNFIVIDDSTYLCKEARNNHTQQIRYIYKQKKEVNDYSNLAKLNNVSIRYNEDINILSTITQHNPSNDIIIEMPIGLNYINMYSLDDSFARTVCVGKSLFNIERIQNNNRWDRIYTFSDLRLFENFWGVLYINESEKNYQLKRKNYPSILLFDWTGNSLAKLTLNQFATSFDIDLQTSQIYTFDVETELFFKYDITNALSSLNIAETSKN